MSAPVKAVVIPVGNTVLLRIETPVLCQSCRQTQLGFLFCDVAETRGPGGAYIASKVFLASCHQCTVTWFKVNYGQGPKPQPGSQVTPPDSS